MKDNPPDDHHSQAQDCVQDYLDVLLMPAAEPLEVVKMNPAEQPQAEVQEQPTKTKVLPSLTMVGGRSSPSTATKPGPGSAGQLPIVPNKPFAEPTKLLAFNLPLPPEVPLVEPVKTTHKENPKSPPVASSTDEPAAIEPEPPGQKIEIESAAKPEKEITTTHWLENGRPSWAQQRFECLLFSVGGLTLAVPLVELGTIYPISDELTPIFGQVDWFLGLLPVKEANIRTVNTAKVVMPERYCDAMKEHIRYVISINGVDWGLAVDSVSTAITLNPEEVRWRSVRSKRPWLAGTVVEHMCALLDLSQLALMFVEQDRQNQRPLT